MSNEKQLSYYDDPIILEKDTFTSDGNYVYRPEDIGRWQDMPHPAIDPDTDPLTRLPDQKSTADEAEFERSAYERLAKAGVYLGKASCGNTVAFQVALPEGGDPEETLLVLPGWGGTPFKPISAVQTVAVMKQNPNARVITLSNPGVDKSDPLPPSIARQQRKDGRFKGEGEYLIEALRPVLDEVPNSKVGIRGHSQGALRGLGVAAAGLDVENYIGIDPPGTRKSYPGLVKDFVVNAAANAGKVGTALKERDPITSKWQEYNDAHMINDIKSQLRNPRAFAQHWLTAPWVMSRGALEANIREALDGGLGGKHLRFMIPSESELNSYPAVLDILKRQAQHAPAGTVLEGVKFPGVHFTVNDPTLLGRFYKF